MASDLSALTTSTIVTHTHYTVAFLPTSQRHKLEGRCGDGEEGRLCLPREQLWWGGPTKAEVNVGSHDYHAAESCSMFTHKSVPLRRGDETLQLSFEPEEVNQPNESKG